MKKDDDIIIIEDENKNFKRSYLKSFNITKYVYSSEEEKVQPKWIKIKEKENSGKFNKIEN